MNITVYRNLKYLDKKSRRPTSTKARVSKLGDNVGLTPFAAKTSSGVLLHKYPISSSNTKLQHSLYLIQAAIKKSIAYQVKGHV